VGKGKRMVGHNAWHLEFLGDLGEAAEENPNIILFFPK